MNRRLPVTLVGGFLGAGKTSLLHHFISEHQGGNLAVLVENPGTPNLDAKALRGLCGAMRRFSDTVLKIPPVDETAQFAWLANQLHELARDERFERVLIEVSGTANAARLGTYVKSRPETELHQIICLVDALDFHRGFVLSARSHPPASLLDFQRAQIEAASLLVLNKCDVVGEAERTACLNLLLQMNPDAPLIETAYGELPAEIWSRPETFRERDLALERNARPRMDAIQIETEVASPLTSSLYRAHRPFHPARFWDWFNADHPGLLRVKGIVWLATRNLLVGGISRTRWQNACGGAGIWWAALPREEWPQDGEILARIRETWREPYGDRRQELVLLGEAAQLPGIMQQLNGCLLTADEYARPVRAWVDFPDPFPVWDVGEES